MIFPGLASWAKFSRPFGTGTQNLTDRLFLAVQRQVRSTFAYESSVDRLPEHAAACLFVLLPPWRGTDQVGSSLYGYPSRDGHQPRHIFRVR